jgi:hypothetical protein
VRGKNLLIRLALFKQNLENEKASKTRDAPSLSLSLFLLEDPSSSLPRGREYSKKKHRAKAATMADTGAPWTTIGKRERRRLPIDRASRILLSPFSALACDLSAPFLSNKPKQRGIERIFLKPRGGEYRERDGTHVRDERTPKRILSLSFDRRPRASLTPLLSTSTSSPPSRQKPKKKLAQNPTRASSPSSWRQWASRASRWRSSTPWTPRH